MPYTVVAPMRRGPDPATIPTRRRFSKTEATDGKTFIGCFSINIRRHVARVGHRKPLVFF